MPAQKPNLLNGNHLLVWYKNVFQFLVRRKIFGPAQNNLGPVKGRGIKMEYLIFIDMYTEFQV